LRLRAALARIADGESNLSGLALEDCAVQDVGITLARADRESSAGAGFSWYGTTLRVFDPATGGWNTTLDRPCFSIAHRIGRTPAGR
jgi:hypothetical protein